LKVRVNLFDPNKKKRVRNKKRKRTLGKKKKKEKQPSCLQLPMHALLGMDEQAFRFENLNEEYLNGYSAVDTSCELSWFKTCPDIATPVQAELMIQKYKYFWMNANAYGGIRNLVGLVAEFVLKKRTQRAYETSSLCHIPKINRKFLDAVFSSTKRVVRKMWKDVDQLSGALDLDVFDYFTLTLGELSGQIKARCDESDSTTPWLGFDVFREKLAGVQIFADLGTAMQVNIDMNFLQMEDRTKKLLKQQVEAALPGILRFKANTPGNLPPPPVRSMGRLVKEIYKHILMADFDQVEAFRFVLRQNLTSRLEVAPRTAASPAEVYDAKFHFLEQVHVILDEHRRMFGCLGAYRWRSIQFCEQTEWREVLTTPLLRHKAAELKIELSNSGGVFGQCFRRFTPRKKCVFVQRVLAEMEDMNADALGRLWLYFWARQQGKI
jgi:hypothetical protein